MSRVSTDSACTPSAFAATNAAAVTELSGGHRWGGRGCHLHRKIHTISAILLVAMVLIPAAISRGQSAQVDRTVLVDALSMPPIRLNLEITFPISDLRVPSTDDVGAEISKLEKQIASDDSAELHLRLANLYSWQGLKKKASEQYTTAIEMYRQLLKDNPDDAKAHQRLARALIARGKEEQAVDHIERSLMLDPNRWQTRELASYLHSKRGLNANNQGWQWHRENHFVMAQQEAKKAIELAPEEPLPRVALFVSKWIPALLQLRRAPADALRIVAQFEEASRVLMEAAERAAAYPRIRQYAISAKFAPFFSAQMVKGLENPIWDDLNQQQKRILTACRDEFIDIGKAHPDMKPQMLLFAGVAEFLMGNSEKMYQRLHAAADADPHSIAALQTMTAFLAREEKWDEALKVAEQMLRRNPGGNAYAWLGRIYAEQQRWRPAEHAFRIATTFPEVRGIANLGLGIVLLKRGASAGRAMLPLQIAYRQKPDEPRALLAWGTALILIDHTDAGRQFIANALKMLPATPQLQAVAKELQLPLQESTKPS